MKLGWIVVIMLYIGSSKIGNSLFVQYDELLWMSVVVSQVGRIASLWCLGDSVMAASGARF